MYHVQNRIITAFYFSTFYFWSPLIYIEYVPRISYLYSYFCLNVLFRKIKILEWEPNYEPRQMHTPGLGIKDFVSDVGQIVKNTSGRSRRRGRKGRRKISPRNNSKNIGLYYQPGTASANSSLYDDGSNGLGTVMSTIDGSFDSSNNEDIDDEYPIQEENANPRYGDNRRVRFRDNQPNYNTSVTNGSSLPYHNEGRQRIMSDGTDGTDEKADDENSDDMELL